MSHKVFALVPAYNEEPRIEKALKKIKKYDDEMVVVDEGSKDQTINVLKKMGVKVVKHKVNKGLGGAIKTGYKEFMKSDCDIAVIIHGDGQHDPAEIPLMIKPLVEDKADYVLGSRFKGDQKSMTFGRSVGNKMISFLWRMATGYDLTDFLTGYHAITKAALKKLEPEKWSNRFLVETDMISDLVSKGMRIEEIPSNCIMTDRPSYLKRQVALSYSWCAVKFMFKKNLTNKF